MAVTEYSRSLSIVFGGSVNSGNLRSEIGANLNITTGMDDNAPVSVDAGADAVIMRFKNALPAGEELELDTVVIPAHDSTPSAEPQMVQIDQSKEQRVYPSPRPKDRKTFFSSAGDSAAPGDGPLLKFKMTPGDSEKSVDVSYLETVLIKDGYVVCQGAPFGSWVSAEMYTPDGLTKVGAFVVRSLMLGDAWMPFDTEDYGTLPTGYILRITVHNSDGTGDDDPAADFKVIARVEMFRMATV
jgi:hypothetical protein